MYVCGQPKDFVFNKFSSEFSMKAPLVHASEKRTLSIQPGLADFSLYVGTTCIPTQGKTHKNTSKYTK
jgi:hypothetical protein